MEAELAGPVTILTHAELLGQAERGRNQREAPRSAGRCTVGDSDGPRCNTWGNAEQLKIPVGLKWMLKSEKRRNV